MGTGGDLVGGWSEPAGWLAAWEVDDLSITVEVVDHPGSGEPPQEVWEATVISVQQSDGIDYETMGALIAALTMGDGSSANHTVDYRRGFTEWGASGAGQSIILKVSDMILAGVTGAVAYDALRAAVRRLVDAGRSRSDWAPEPLTVEEAVARAEAHLGWKYGLHDDDYQFTGELVGQEERSDGSQVVRFRHGDRRYEVEFVEERGLVAIARTRWTAEP